MLHLPYNLIEIIRWKFEKQLEKYEVKTFEINKLEKVVVLNDSLLLYIGIQKSDYRLCENYKKQYKWTKKHPFMEMPKKSIEHYELYIEELTFNEIGFYHNHKGFTDKMGKILGITNLELDVSYTRFKGWKAPYWNEKLETLPKQIDKLIPQLELKQRYKNWSGVPYYFIIMEILTAKQNREYAVAYTTQNPDEYMKKKTISWIKHGMGGSDNIRMDKMKFKEGFDSWLKVPRKYLLQDEKTFRYTFAEKKFREKDDVWRYADVLLKQAYSGEVLFEKNMPEKKEEIFEEKKLISTITSKGEFIQIKSALLKSYYYNKTLKRFYLEFAYESFYSYDEVPSEIVEEFLESPSKGKYFLQKIKNYYDYKKIEREEVIFENEEIEIRYEKEELEIKIIILSQKHLKIIEKIDFTSMKYTPIIKRFNDTIILIEIKKYEYLRFQKIVNDSLYIGEIVHKIEKLNKEWQILYKIWIELEDNWLKKHKKWIKMYKKMEKLEAKKLKYIWVMEYVEKQKED